MFSIINATLQFLSITAIIWLPIFILSLLSTKLITLLGRRLTMILGIIGVPIHEIGHLTFCVLFGHKVVSFRLFSPSVDGTFGYVNHSYKKTWFSPFTLLLIGLAPLFSGIAALYTITYLLRPDLLALVFGYHFVVTDLNSGFIAFAFIGSAILNGEMLETILWSIFTFSIILFMSPSKADFQSCRKAVFMLIALFVLFTIVAPHKLEQLGEFFKTVFLVLSWPLYVTIAILCLLSLCVIMLKAFGVIRPMSALKGN